MDFYFWGVIKNKVYKNRPRDIDDLRLKITEACQSIAPAELKRVVKHNRKRIEKCIILDGGLVEKGPID